MAINWAAVIRDLKDLHAIRSALQTASKTWSEEEHVLTSLGKCGLCGTNITFKVKAICSRDGIRALLHRGQSCPECGEDLHEDHVHYHGINAG